MVQEKLDNFLRYMKNELERQARLYPSKFSGTNGRSFCTVLISVFITYLICSCYNQEGHWDWTRYW